MASDRLQMEIVYSSWLEELWSPFEQSRPPSSSPSNTIIASSSTTTTTTTTNMASASTSSSSSAAPALPIRSKVSAGKKTRDPYPVLCRCPNGGGQKPARHWRTVCPYNTNRKEAETLSCGVCGRTFNRLDNLKRHQRGVHSDA